LLVIDSDKSLDVISNIMSSYGIQVKDANGNYRELNDVISEISDMWDKINQDKKEILSIQIVSSYPVYVATSAKKIGTSIKSVLEKLNNKEV
jgi:hypothetical protein